MHNVLSPCPPWTMAFHSFRPTATPRQRPLYRPSMAEAEKRHQGTINRTWEKRNRIGGKRHFSQNMGEKEFRGLAR